jgi:hypothetical protein
MAGEEFLSGCTRPNKNSEFGVSTMRLLPLVVSSLLMSAAVAQDLLAEAQIEMRNRLRDPESAQFDNLRAAQKTVNDKKAQVVCGNVNAKNRAGQLSGPSPFVFLGESRETWLARSYDILKDPSKDQDSGARMYQQYCS